MDGFEGSEGSEAIHDDGETYESDDRDKAICHDDDESNAESEDATSNDFCCSDDDDDDESNMGEKREKEGTSNWRRYCCCNDATTHSPDTDITHSSTTQVENEASGSQSAGHEDTSKANEEDKTISEADDDKSNAEAQDDHNTDRSSAEEDDLNEENSYVVYEYTTPEDTEPWWLARPKPIYTIRRVRKPAPPLTNNGEDGNNSNTQEEDESKVVDESRDAQEPSDAEEDPSDDDKSSSQKEGNNSNTEEEGNNSNTEEDGNNSNTEEDGNKAVDHSNAEEDDIKEEEEENYDSVYVYNATNFWWEPPYSIHRVKRPAHQPPTSNEEDGSNSNTQEDENKAVGSSTPPVGRSRTGLFDCLCTCFRIKPRDARQLSDAEQDPPVDDESSSQNDGNKAVDHSSAEEGEDNV